MERLHRFFSGDYMAPHGFCFLWVPEIVWTHVISDALIALAYFSIPIALWRFAKKRPDIPFNKVFLLFASFITLCGLTHVFDILVLWWPYYGVQGLLLLATGLVSASTAILVWRIMPSALVLPSPAKLEQLNRDLQASKDQIEEKVQERTRELELANIELIRARQEADEASQTKSEFLANMSHEIRTPINVVVGVTDILAAKPDMADEKKEKLLETLQVSAKTLVALIDDLLDISKIESQVIEMESIPFNLKKMVEDSASLMKIRAREKGLDFRVENQTPSLEEDVFLGDPKRLQQIMLNLCSNALKFTEKGGVIVTMAVTANDAYGKNISIAVADTGIGISKEKQPLVFEKFVQADSSINRKYGGTGLGLAITKRLVTMMGGTIELESEDGEGTIFTINLRLKTTAQTPLSSIDDNIANKPISGLKNILLVEDYEPNVLVATTFLRQMGHDCDIASSGLDALKMAKKKSYDLILMDVQMPVMDGIEATKLIRAHERSENNIPVAIIGITAHAMIENKRACIAAGMHDVLIKPYTATDLKDKITQAFKNA